MVLSDRLYYVWLETLDQRLQQGHSAEDAVKDADTVVKAVTKRFKWVTAEADTAKAAPPVVDLTEQENT